MDIRLVRLHGGGAFGDVWEGEDTLGRRVAVKIIREAGMALSSARDHARALARAQHANVVVVYSLETVADPQSGDPVECVVMEWLEGVTLSERLRSTRFTAEEVSRIGGELIAGLRHIHEQRLAHGDLHADNVMIVDGRAKIIDILYLDSLALLSTASRETRVARDLLSLRLILQQVLLHSELDPAEAADFNASLTSNPTVVDVAAAFRTAIDPTRREDLGTLLAHAYGRLLDDGFVAGSAYAVAVAQETPDSILVPLFERIIDERSATKKHSDYIRLVWPRISPIDRQALLVKLGNAIERETPRGRWSPLLWILAALGPEGWQGLSPVVRIRLEGQITTDVLAGRHDIYGTALGNPGALGTWAKTFWPFFDNLDQLSENIAALLRQDWYKQNYVGKNFMQMIPLLGNVPERRAPLIRGLASAVSNDAKIVVSELANLPPDWQSDVARRSFTL